MLPGPTNFQLAVNSAAMLFDDLQNYCCKSANAKYPFRDHIQLPPHYYKDINIITSDTCIPAWPLV